MQCDKVDTTFERELNLSGMKLAEGSQRLFYIGIGKSKTTSQCWNTSMRLVLTIYTVQEFNSIPPTLQQVWNSIWDSDLPKAIRGFLWKCMHNAYKIGEHWSKMPNFSHRSHCTLCGEEEIMEYILISCELSSERKIIWNLAEQLWCKWEDTWPSISIGTILGAGLIDFKNSKGKSITGKSRLLKIIFSELAYLIWKLRCEKCIKFEGNKEKYHSDFGYVPWTTDLNSTKS